MKVFVSGDIGCYTLGFLPPLSAMDSCVCMGASVPIAHGMAKALGEEAHNKIVSVIGDSTFIHSGITGLINTVYNNSASTLIILDNRITAMTGQQHNPASGSTIKGEPAHALDLEALCRAIGVKHVYVVNPHDVVETPQGAEGGGGTERTIGRHHPGPLCPAAGDEAAQDRCPISPTRTTASAACPASASAVRPSAGPPSRKARRSGGATRKARRVSRRSTRSSATTAASARRCANSTRSPGRRNRNGNRRETSSFPGSAARASCWPAR